MNVYVCVYVISVCKHLPAILWRLEEFLLVDELRHKIGVRVSYQLLREALTSGNIMQLLMMLDPLMFIFLFIIIS